MNLPTLLASFVLSWHPSQYATGYKVHFYDVLPRGPSAETVIDVGNVTETLVPKPADGILRVFWLTSYAVLPSIESLPGEQHFYPSKLLTFRFVKKPAPLAFEGSVDLVNWFPFSAYYFVEPEGTPLWRLGGEGIELDKILFTYNVPSYKVIIEAPANQPQFFCRIR